MAEKDKKTRKIGNVAHILMNVACMVILGIIILTCVFKWLNTYTRHGEYVTVPSITGMFEEEAANTLAQYGLRYEVNGYRFDKEVVEGGIIEQFPKAGAGVKRDRTIYITINTGKQPMKRVPDLADNSSLRAAESQLIAAGFRLGHTIRVDGDLDWVYEIRYQGDSISAGTEIPEGSLLTIVAGNGTPVEIIEEADSIQIIDMDFFEED